MMKENKGTEELIAKYLLGIISEPENETLNQWIQASPHHEETFHRLLTDTSFRKRYELYSEIDSEHAWKRFKKAYCRYGSINAVVFIKYAAIFLLPILLLGGGWHYYTSPTMKESFSEYIETEDAIQPGITKAILIRSQHEKQPLIAAVPTEIKVGHTATAVAQNGTLIYPASPVKNKTQESGQPESNTLATEQGNEFRVAFEDGTTVHLNYNTELRYPIKFGKTQRIVYLKGEAYFTVAKDTRPFYVVTENGTIKQYGTEFNVNTFTPNRTEVVLVKGSISITSPSKSKEQFIKPGQLAYTNPSNDDISIQDVDTAPYVAWNEGRLIFENRNLESIMEILEHWYKVKISFGSPKLKQLHFTGNMDRYGTITPILKAIARTTNLCIKIEGRDILITDN